MTPPSPEGLVVTQASLDDWPVIKGWAADEGWDPGKSDGACFFTQDPEGFFLGRIDGEPVSAISVVNYGADYAFLGCYLVRPDVRGRGYGLTTWKTALAHAGGRTVGLDGVVAQQGNYRQSGFELAYKTFRFGGVPAAGESAGTGVRAAGAADLDAITAYDSACYPADRAGFVEHWLTEAGHRALVRIVDGRLTGYSVIRPALTSLRIGPLFADTAEDARALFAALAAEADGRPVSVDIPETSATGVALAEEYGLTPSFETARMYTGPVRPYAADRVYGVTTLELG
ncbi:GNAT family N-acetyltransferase [Streptomyces phaeochromogenes]|uniref:GNAT family N-acetyltransferase n=1 Tax=Streptomyces phaeochromogenes TaxID=1923 RepID=A0ABZ1HRV1_STRPH|nr:GNAT family N-acetyltransferase [Streptomyces phaeochromogenes]WSD20201.1 GNAT family N-acetyltransferase [Streptomyces phaeochromogenes]WSJ03109.1 GNAT family N-acetyltransferase [Streptomyces phaeochromogenes]